MRAWLLLGLAALGLAGWAEARPGKAKAPPTPGPTEQLPPPLCEAAKEQGFVVAEDGTLFRTLDLRDQFYIPLDTLPELERFLRAFQDVGVQLVVPLIPTRGLGMAEKLTGLPEAERFRANLVEEAYHGTLRWLALNGAVAVDLMPAIQAPDRDRRFFHRYDHHWTAEGSRDAAKATAAAIRETEAAKRIPNASHVTTRTGELTELARLAARVEELCGVQMPHSFYNVYETKPLAPPSLGLLDEPPPVEVVVAGSSFMSERFHFEGFLAEALGAEVITVQTGGGQAFGGLHEYLLSDDYRAHRPAVLVWELVMSFIMAKSDGDESPAVRDVDIYRELTAAIWGDCPGEAVAEFEGEASGAVELPLKGQSFEARDHYLSVSFPQGGVESLTVVSRTADDATERFRFPVYSRLDRKGRFMLTLDPELPGEVAGLRLRLPEGVSTPMTARLCRAP